MKLYQAFAMDLNHFLNGARAVRITVPGYMPLSVEEIGISQDGHRLVSLCQYGEQNGDLMRDCDLVFMVTDLPHRHSSRTSVLQERLPGAFTRSVSV